jgi:hypothetical protein
MKYLCRELVIAIALLAAIWSDSWGQSQNQSPSDPAAQPPAADQRGTDQAPIAIKILPAPDAEEQANKAERERKEKAVIDEKLAFETQRIADYTARLAWFTCLLFGIAIFQAGLFFWQLRMMREDAKRARAAFISANRPKIIVHFADLKRFPDPDPKKAGASELDHLGIVILCFNKGRGIANDVEVRAEIIVSNTIPDAKIMRKMSKPVIKSVAGGIKIWSELNSGRPIQEMLAFAHEAKAYCVGTIVYFDENKSRRETGFCFRFATQGMRWINTESPPHEHAY